MSRCFTPGRICMERSIGTFPHRGVSIGRSCAIVPPSLRGSRSCEPRQKRRRRRATPMRPNAKPSRRRSRMPTEKRQWQGSSLCVRRRKRQESPPRSGWKPHEEPRQQPPRPRSHVAKSARLQRHAPRQPARRHATPSLKFAPENRPASSRCFPDASPTHTHRRQLRWTRSRQSPATQLLNDPQRPPPPEPPSRIARPPFPPQSLLSPRLHRSPAWQNEFLHQTLLSRRNRIADPKATVPMTLPACARSTVDRAPRDTVMRRPMRRHVN